MTRLMVMYNDLDPRTESSVRKFAPEAGLEPEWVDTSPSVNTYADELDKRWTGDEDLIVVEQDKEVHGSCFPTFLVCDSLWCTYTCWVFPVPHTALALGAFGVTRFSAEIQRLVPVAEFRGPFQQGIDRRFYDTLTERGIGCCYHGHVLHHHVYEPRPQRVRNHVAELRAQGLVDPAPYPEPLDPGLLPGSYRLTPDVPAGA